MDQKDKYYNMNVFNYIIIGVIFMFMVEFFTNSKILKKYLKKHSNLEIEFGFWERTLGILFWPVFLGIFLYNFFKQYFK